MRNFTKVAALAVLVLGASGCSSTYKCPLGNECSDVYDSYRAAAANGGNKETTMPNANKHGVPFDQQDEDEKKIGLQAYNPYAGGAMTERPVYQPPRPLRIWIAPWQAQLDSLTQTDPVLMSGQFMYATIPGFWSMGVMRADGSLSPVMMLEPSDPPEEQQQQNNRIQPK